MNCMKDYINKTKYFLFDGAIGTYYALKNRPYSLAQANILDYNTIVSIHKEYISSGAQAISTNTFCNSDLRSIQAAISAAKDAVRDKKIHIFASIGPLSDYTLEEYKPIIDTFIEGGISNFLFETFASTEIIFDLVNYIKYKLINSFIITSFAVDQNGYTSQGIFYHDIINKVKDSPYIDSYGFNCVSGPVHMLSLASKLDNTDILSIMPNAGYPSFINGQASYTDNPHYFAEKLIDIHKLGVKILGGCCGTTPKHIKILRDLLDKDIKKNKVIIPKTKSVPQQKPKNTLQEKIEGNNKIIIVEYDPPLTATGSDVTNASQLLEQAGVDAISIADNPLGRARADSLIIASRIKRDTSCVDVIPHLTCRDRNAISIRSALMGLKTEDIYNLLCITGDPVSSCYDKQAKGVFSFSSISLLKYVNSINNEDSSIEYYCGAALNINANKFTLELERAKKKVQAGAKYFITQPCFTQESIQNIISSYNELKVPIIVGLMPLKSYRNAIFINSEISGIDIPLDIVEKYIDKSPEECIDISIEVTMNIIDKISNYVKGYHLITPPKGEDIIVRLAKEINNDINR